TDQTSQTCPAHHALPTAKLTDENNLEQLKLPFQQKAVDVFHKQQAQDRNNRDHEVSNVTMVAEEDEGAGEQGDKEDTVSGIAGQKRLIVLDNDSDPESEVPLKKPCILLGNPTAVGNDGLLADINVQSIEEQKEAHEDKQRDVDHFFHKPMTRQVNGKEKRYCLCKVCP
ncbi:hypothetical protein C0993_003283, partial [Termitomyces sp. T159_Od127]